MYLATFRRSLATKWSLWKLALPVGYCAALSIICYGIGWYMSTSASAMPLARAGAAATAISTAFTLYNYRRRIRVSENDAAKLIKRITDNFQITGPASLQDAKRRLRENTQGVTRAIVVAQAMLLIIATLVWGFGDLASRFMCSIPR